MESYEDSPRSILAALTETEGIIRLHKTPFNFHLITNPDYWYHFTDFRLFIFHKGEFRR